MYMHYVEMCSCKRWGVPKLSVHKNVVNVLFMEVNAFIFLVGLN